MSDSAVKKAKNNRVAGTVTTVILVIAVLLCLFVAFQVLGNGYATFGKVSMFRVITGSMEPEIPVGSLIMSEKVDIDEINIGDVVTFKSKSAEIYGSIVTHRVVDITKSDSGAVLLYTRGDANSAADVLPVDANNFVGKVTKVLDGANFFSKILAFFTSQSGFIVCIVLPVLFVSGILMQNSIKNIKRDISNLNEEFDKIKSNSIDKISAASEQTEGSGATDKSSTSALTEAEYKDIYEKIRAELMTELKEELTESETGERSEQ